MKNIFKYTYLALVGMVAMVAASCSDDCTYNGRGEWDAADGYANIYFAITDSTLELDPADPTIVTVAVSRRNTQGALTIPFEIHQNTDSVFTVSDAVFADGEAETEITLSFPNAEIGKPYTLEITTSDPEVVSQYSAGAIYTIEVTRVKWNDVGFYYKETDDGKKEKVDSAMYTDDFVGSAYNTGNLSYPVKVQERADMKGLFRMVNAYETYPYGQYDGTVDRYIIINATNPEKVYISPCEFNLGIDVTGDGLMHVLHLGGYYVEAAEIMAATGNTEKEKEYLEEAEKYYGKYENGKITFPASSFYLAEENYKNGDWVTYGNYNGAFSLIIDPDLDPHNADMSSDEDFEWEEVFAGNFKSNKMGIQKDGVKLYKGTCINTTDSCDVRFAKEYGTAYKIESPYADGCHLYFAVDSTGAVTLPEDLKYQYTGIQPLGADSKIYAVISPVASTFTERVITLKIAFQTQPDKDGNYTELGSAEEVLSYITWTKVGTGTYTYTSFFADYDEETEEDIPYADGPLDIYQRDDKPTIYKVTDWGYGADFIFTWDGKDGDGVTVPASFTGYTDNYYGDVYVSDIPTFSDKYDYTQFPNTYDSSSQTFSFNVAYWCEQGLFANSKETLEVKWGASETSRAATTKKRLSINKTKTQLANKKQHSWFGKGTKVNVKNKKALPVSAKAPLFVK